MPGCGLGDREVAHGTRGIRAEGFAKRGQLERAWCRLHEDANAGQQSQHPVQRLRVRPDFPSELVTSPRTVGEAVSDP